VRKFFRAENAESEARGPFTVPGRAEVLVEEVVNIPGGGERGDDAVAAMGDNFQL
jgi:hypothetical protein